MSEGQRCSATETVRAAQINVNHGETIGACLFLSVEDLLTLGVDPQRSREIVYRIDPDNAYLTISSDAQAENTDAQATEHRSSINR